MWTTRRLRPSRNRFLPFLALAVLAASASTGVAAPLDATAWKYRQAFSLEHPGFVRLALPLDTIDRSRPGFADLRLLDPDGRELPYVIDIPGATTATLRAPADIRIQLTRTATAFTVVTGTTAPLDAVRLTSPERSFLKSATLEASPDGRTWTTVATGQPVFRRAGTESLQLPLDARSAAFLRVTLDDTTSAPVAFSNVTLVLAASDGEFALPLDARLTHREEFVGETALTLDLGARHLPLAAAEFTISTPQFRRAIRAVTPALRDGRASDRVEAAGELSRPPIANTAPPVRFPLNFTADSRELHLRITNGDSPPLALDHVRIFRRPVWLVFRTDRAGAHTLLTGHPGIAAPHYDVTAFAADLPAARLVKPAVTPLADNPDFDAPAPLATVPLTGAPLDPSAWRYRRAVDLATEGVFQLELDLPALAHTRDDLGDLRLVQDRRQIPYLLDRPDLLRPVAVNVTAASDEQHPSLSRWLLTLPESSLPLRHLTLAASTAVFDRTLYLREEIPSDRGPRVVTLATVPWRRAPDSSPTDLVIALPQRLATRTLMLSTDNGDNRALALDRVAADHAVVRLLFRADAGPVQLYYGNPAASPPRYDLDLAAPQLIAADKSPVPLGPEETARDDGWPARVASGLRGGLVFWLVLGLVVVVLLLIVAKLLPAPRAT
ncbi:DUF3999 domain-containing protein [Horticoccus luteus]|uniref:DUF3999 domain-containing protein n=1 Tax=Horticoccus luteus TaxID=2862869 RepID=A0A8F9TW65_9BACT|nr:DUF3999 domain-containing protein [Horticoccus luteus]QYM79197.1 DUF3999 domain-containing protein [Horticoccus luteus]